MNFFLLDTPIFVARYLGGDDLVLVSSRRRLLQVARKEGLVTFNPETQTQADLDTLLGP